MLGKATMFAAALVASLALAGGPAKAITYSATLAGWQPGAGAPASGRSTFTPAADGVFLSLGLGGIAVFSFGEPFIGPGAVVEVTNGDVNTYPESVEVYVGNSFTPGDFSLGGFTLVATILNTLAQSPGALFPIDLPGTFQYLLLRDITVGPPNGVSTDGFDVDAIGVTVVPLPAGAALLGSGLAALGFLGWRRKRTGTAAA